MQGAAESAFREFREHGRPRDLARVFDLTAQELLLAAGHLARGEEDARELVQQTFLVALEQRERWDASRPLLTWLLGILLRLRWRERRRLARSREHGGDVDALPSAIADPARHAEDAELAAALAGAIAGLPEAYRDVLSLRLVHGLEAVEIAHALGRPLETVKTQLKRGKDRLRDALPRSLAALVALEGDGLSAVRIAVLAAAQGTTASTALATLGMVLMGKQTVGVAVVIVCAGGLWWVRASAEDPQEDATRRALASASTAVVQTPAAVIAGEATSREVVAPLPDPASLASEPARLACHVRWESDGAPAAGVTVWLWHAGQGRVPVNAVAITDADGGVLFEDLPAGRAIVAADRGARAELVMESGANEVDLAIPPGLLVRGVVLDEHDAPVPGAELWLSDEHVSSSEGTWLARTSADGRFELRDVPPNRALAARSAGHAPGEGIWFEGAPGERLDVTLRVGAAGPRFRGSVCDERGEPIENAYLFVGHAVGPRRLERDNVRYITSPPQCTSTDKEGLFALDAVPVRDSLPLWIAAEGFATGHEELSAEEVERPVVITLLRPARLVGTLRDSDGASIALAEVSVRDVQHDRPDWRFLGPEWGRRQTWTGSDGSFEIEALRPGPVELVAAVRMLGEARANVELVAGETFTWSAEVAPAGIVAGIVVDERGEPLRGMHVYARCQEHAQPHSLESTVTDVDGRFRLRAAVCDRYALHVRDESSDLTALVERSAIAPGMEEVEIVIPASHRATARLVGRLVATDGSPYTADRVHLMRQGENGSGQSGGGLSRCVDGALETGLLLPGTYTLTVMSVDSGAWAVGTFDLAQGETHNIGEHVCPAFGRIELELVDAAGVSVSDARFSLRSESDSLGALLEFRGGRCVRERIQPGRYVLRSFGSDLPMMNTRIEVRPGETTRETIAFPVTFERWLQFATPTRLNELECLCKWTCNGEELLAGRWTFRTSSEPRPPEARPLPPGCHVITFTTDDGRSETTTFDVSADTASSDQVVFVRAPFE